MIPSRIGRKNINKCALSRLDSRVMPPSKKLV